MRRRDAVALLGGAAFCPLVVGAQPGRTMTIGMLSPFAQDIGPPAFDAFENELRSLGWWPGLSSHCFELLPDMFVAFLSFG
jgi:hypothetical protein